MREEDSWVRFLPVQLCEAHCKKEQSPGQQVGNEGREGQDANLDLFNWQGQKNVLLDAVPMGSTGDRDAVPGHTLGSSSRS